MVHKKMVSGGVNPPHFIVEIPRGMLQLAFIKAAFHRLLLHLKQ